MRSEGVRRTAERLGCSPQGISDALRMWFGTFVTGIIRTGDVVSGLILSPRPYPIATSSLSGMAAANPLRHRIIGEVDRGLPRTQYLDPAARASASIPRPGPPSAFRHVVDGDRVCHQILVALHRSQSCCLRYPRSCSLAAVLLPSTADRASSHWAVTAPVERHISCAIEARSAPMSGARLVGG